MRNSFLKLFSLVSVFVLAEACSTSASRPVENVQGLLQGVVVYNPHGIKELVDQRRESAIERIETICPDGKYKITSEQKAAADSRAFSSDNSLATFGANELVFIDYLCTRLELK